MNQWQEYAGFIAGILSSIGFVFYSLSTFKGPTKPNRASWWIWTFVGFLLLYSEYKVGSVYTVWVPAIYAVGPLIVAILSLWKGEPGFSRLDKACLGGASICLALFLWWHGREHRLWITHVLCLMVDLIGVLPTFLKIYREPEKESRVAWTLFALSNIANVCAVESLKFEKVAYPIYMLVVNGLLTAMAYQTGTAKKVLDKREGKEERPLTRV